MERNARRVRNIDNINTKVIYYNVARDKIERRRQKRMLVKRIKIGGTVVAVASVFLGGTLLFNNFKDNEKESEATVVTDNVDDTYKINTSVSSLSNLNVVFVNDGITDNLEEEISDPLEKVGLDFKWEDMSSLELDGTETIVSFTPYIDTKPKVIANYNDGNSYSDALAAAFASSVGSLEDSLVTIQKGVHDTASNDNSLCPSNIEKATDNEKVTTVTIALPVDNFNNMDLNLDDRYDITNIVVEGLARFQAYTNDYSLEDSSCLKRIKNGENLSHELRTLNNMDDYTTVQEGSIYLAKLPNAFKDDVDIHIMGFEKGKSY